MSYRQNYQSSLNHHFRSPQAVEHKLAVTLAAAKDQGFEGEELGVFKLKSRQRFPAKHSEHKAFFRRRVRWDKD